MPIALKGTVRADPAWFRVRVERFQYRRSIHAPSAAGAAFTCDDPCDIFGVGFASLCGVVGRVSGEVLIGAKLRRFFGMEGHRVAGLCGGGPYR